MTPGNLNDSIHISGLAVQVNPAKIEQVTQSLNQVTGVEVHISDPSGKLVVTIEELPGQKLMVDTMTRISQVEGVVSTALVYSHQS